MVKPVTTAAKPYFVYIVRCADDSLYTGIAQDVATRLQEHNSSPKGAKYTRSRRPVSHIMSSYHSSRGAALKEEARIKKMSRQQKITFINNTSHNIL